MTLQLGIAIATGLALVCLLLAFRAYQRHDKGGIEAGDIIQITGASNPEDNGNFVVERTGPPSAFTRLWTWLRPGQTDATTTITLTVDPKTIAVTHGLTPSGPPRRAKTPKKEKKARRKRQKAARRKNRR